MLPDDTLEFTGNSIDEAVAAGIAELGVQPNDVMVEILEEPSRGVFGIGARPARVRLKLLKQPAPPPTADVSPPEDDYKDDDGYEGVIDPDDLEGESAVAREILMELLERMGIEADIRVVASDDEDDPWTLDIITENEADTSLLIGRKGETLTALQYITRLIASRRLERRANIIVDAGSYKSRRSDRLEHLALRMADQVVRTQRAVTLEPMPPNERRVIHMTLRERDDVETRSSGEGGSRKVTILPIEFD